MFNMLRCVSPARHYVDTNLMPYTLYSYRVEAVNDAGSVFSPYIIFRTNPGTPSADMSLQVGFCQMLDCCGSEVSLKVSYIPVRHYWHAIH